MRSAERGGEGWSVARAVVSCDVGAVTNPIPYYVTKVFTRSLTRSLAARTHSHALRTFARSAPHISSHSRAPRASAEHTPSRQACALFFAYRFFFVAIVSACAMFALVSTTSNTLNHDHRIHEHTRTHRLCPSLAAAYGCRMPTPHRIPLAVSLLRLAQKKSQVNQHKRNILQKSNI